MAKRIITMALMLISVLVLGSCGVMYHDPYIPVTRGNVGGALGVSDQHALSRIFNTTLPRSASIYVGMPSVPDALQKEYPTAVASMCASIETAFAKQFADVVVAKQPSSLHKALASARSKGMAYLIYPRPAQWHASQLVYKENCTQNKEKNLTPHGASKITVVNDCDWDFSVPIDEVFVSLWLYDVYQQRMLDAITLQGKSGWLTFFNDQPEALLETSLEHLAKQLAANP